MLFPVYRSKNIEQKDGKKQQINRLVGFDRGIAVFDKRRGGGCEFGAGVEGCVKKCNGGGKCCDVDGERELE